MKNRIRIASVSDASTVQKIYAPIVTDTAISFETEVPSVVEIEERIKNTLPQYPWLVCESDGEVIGFSYASTYRARVAYQWAVEVTVYVGQKFRGQGVGKDLYQALFEILKKQGYRTLVGGITIPNAGSVRVHESFGFRQVAVFKSIGYKMGAWHDVGFWQLELQPYIQSPPAPTPFSQLLDGLPDHLEQ